MKPLSALMAATQPKTAPPSAIEADTATCLHCLTRVYADVAYQINGIAARARTHGMGALVEAMGDKGKAFVEALKGIEQAWDVLADEAWPEMEAKPQVEIVE